MRATLDSAPAPLAPLAPPAPPAPREAAGFSLLELVVAMGLLSGFLMMLVQVLSTGVSIFDAGERGQELADRTHVAARAVRSALGDMVGPLRESFEPAPPTARLIATWAPAGLDDERQGSARVQVLRTTVQLSGVDEGRLLRDHLRADAEDEVGAQGEHAVEQRLGEMIAAYPRTGRGEMLLLPWPAADDDGVYFELRKGLFLAETRPDRQGPTRLTEIAQLGGDELPPEHVVAATEVVATGLLHFELAFWSQHTRSWSGSVGGDGPELSWDSARAGLSAEAEDPRQRFGLDLGPDSWLDSRDDVFPRWIRVTFVVARGANQAPEAILTRPLAADDTTMSATQTDRFPDPQETRYLKVGSEWVRFSSYGSTQVQGLSRGRRGTTAREHRAGTPVRAGRQVVIDFKVPHGRDADG